MSYLISNIRIPHIIYNVKRYFKFYRLIFRYKYVILFLSNIYSEVKILAYEKSLISQKLVKWKNYINNYSLPKWDELPTIELYIDQVIALLTQYLDFLVTESDDKEGKVLTTSAINNYVRMKIMPAPNKKKYSRVHMAYLIVICSLKNSLSISCISKIIPMGIDDEQVKALYSNYVRHLKAAGEAFAVLANDFAEPIINSSDDDDGSVENFLYEMAAISSVSKILTEKVLKLQINEESEEKD